MNIFIGILIPFLGTSLGAACVFFMKRGLSDLVQRSLTGFASGGIYLESSDSGTGAVGRLRSMAVRSGGCWILDRNFLFTDAGPRCSTSSSEQ